LVGSLCFMSSAWAQNDPNAGDPGNTVTPPVVSGETSGAAAFLRLGAGARAQGMGRAFTAFAGNDASASFWNPAGLGTLTKPTGALSGRAFVDADFDTRLVSGVGAYPIGPGALGISLLHFTVGDIEAYDEQARHLGLFNNSEFAFSGSYGYKQGPVSLGVGFRYLSQKFSGAGLSTMPEATESNSGFGFDVGMLYTPTSNLFFGLMMRDGTDIGDVDHMPAGFTAGAGYLFRLRKWHDPEPLIRVALDLEQINGRPLRLHMGTEAEMVFDEKTTCFLRFGISDIFLESRASGNSPSDGILPSQKPSGQSKLTLGFGVIWNQYGLDLAYVSESFDSTSMLSLSYHP
jgi:hypothetical protein